MCFCICRCRGHDDLGDGVAGDDDDAAAANGVVKSYSCVDVF